MFSKFLGESLPNLCEYVLGISGVPKNLLTHPEYAFGVNLFYVVWIGFGSQLILYSGAMSRIPDSLIEFGELEGISLFKEFFHVVVPMIYSTITVFLVTGVSGIFTGQLALYNFYGKEADPDIRTLGYHFFIMVLGEEARYVDYPYASAAGLLFTFVAAPITLVARHLLEKYGPQVEF
jgi:multiple sugar transport system permease protein